MTNAIDQLLNKVVICQTAGSNDHHAMHVQGYYDSPVLLGQGVYADKDCWRADMVRPATVEEQIAYWKNRAMNAEGKGG